VPGDLDLMRVRAGTLFTHDARGRLLLSNEPRVPDRRPAPRLWLGWTAAGHVIRLGATVPDDLVTRVRDALERRLPGPDLDGPPAVLPALRAVLAAHAPVTAETGGPAYRFPESMRPATAAVRLTAANRDLVRESFPWLYDEVADWQPCFAAVADGAAVSVCFSARLSDLAAEAGVETLPAYRGRGHAVAVTAAWGGAISDAGRVPLYSTMWENFASRGVARRLGLVQFGADLGLA
jgi:RimJ/RimL family protein N-acetyltransferase